MSCTPVFGLSRERFDDGACPFKRFHASPEESRWSELMACGRPAP